VLEQVRERVRAVSPPLVSDRPLYRDLAALEALIASGGLQLA
jgi:histidine ammonia-lyase